MRTPISEVLRTMERRASVQNGIARMGDSTKGLLTFGDDMVHVMNEFSPYRKANERGNGLHRIQEDKPRAASSGRIRRSAEPDDYSVRAVDPKTKGNIPRSDSFDLENESPRSVESIFGGYKPRAASSGRLRHSADPEAYSVRIAERNGGGNKSRLDSFSADYESPRSMESILDGSKPRAASSGRVRLSTGPDDFSVTFVDPKDSISKYRSDSFGQDNESPRSVARSKSNERPSRSSGSSTYGSADNKPNGKSASTTRPVPPGRSRPGIRAHRSGSFALRQFKENHQQQCHQPTTRRHYKTKNEARSEVEQNSVPCEVTSPNKSDWKKPALRLHRSMDGSFSVRSTPLKDRETCKSPTSQDDIRYVPPIPLQSSLPESTEIASSSKGIDVGWNETAWDRPMIEVAPGFSLPMCGTAETMQALHLDRIVHVECKSCSVFLACINTAYMVLCPGCRSVSPMETVGYNMSPTLGLGLRVEDILSQIHN